LFRVERNGMDEVHVEGEFTFKLGSLKLIRLIKKIISE
jgi:hypothetical protein